MTPDVEPTDPVVRRARRAWAERDRDTLRPLLHPYVHVTDHDGVTVRGRTNVLAMLSRTTPADAPRACELRDGQVYRWGP